MYADIFEAIAVIIILLVFALLFMVSVKLLSSPPHSSTPPSSEPTQPSNPVHSPEQPQQIACEIPHDAVSPNQSHSDDQLEKLSVITSLASSLSDEQLDKAISYLEFLLSENK